MQSSATSPAEYIRSLPKERAQALRKVRSVIRANLPKGYREGMNFGMIVYEVPLTRYPDTYNKQPLMYAALASQKNHMAVYLTNIYSDPRTLQWFLREYKRTGLKPNMGKSCVRFRNLDGLPLDLIGQAVARTPVEEFIKKYEAARGRTT